MPVAQDALTDDELRRLRGKLTPQEIDALSDDEVQRLHALEGEVKSTEAAPQIKKPGITNQSEAGFVGKPTLRESERPAPVKASEAVAGSKAYRDRADTPVIRQPQYPGQTPPLPTEGPKDVKSFLLSIGQAATSGADRPPEAQEPEYQPPTAAEAEMNSPLLLGERIRKEQDKLIGASQPMSAFKYTPPMDPQNADMLSNVAGTAAYEMVRFGAESMSQFVADPLRQAADHPVEFGLNLITVAAPLVGAMKAGTAAREAAGAVRAKGVLRAAGAEGLLPGREIGELGAKLGDVPTATKRAGDAMKVSALLGGATGAAVGADANEDHPIIGGVVGGLIGAAGGAAAADLVASHKGMRANLEEMRVNLEGVKKNLDDDIESLAAPGFLEKRAWPEQRQMITDKVTEWKAKGLTFDEAYDYAQALKEKGEITGAQESGFIREIGTQYSPVGRGNDFGSFDDVMRLDEHGWDPVLSGPMSAETIARETIAAAPVEEVVAAQGAIDSRITQIDDMKAANRQLGGDPAITASLRESEATLEATSQAITDARAGVEVPRFNAGEYVTSAEGTPLRVLSIEGKAATVVDQSGNTSRVHVDSLKLGDIPPIPDGPVVEPWFAGSQIADEAGAPLTVYHQTASENVSKIKAEGFSTEPSLAHGRLSDQAVPEGIFFKPGEEEISTGRQGPKGQIPVNLSIKNPLKVANREELVAWAKQVDPEYARLAKSPFDEKGVRLDEAKRAADMRARITEALKKNGFDGVILEKDVGAAGSTKTYIALEPNQVKIVGGKTPKATAPVRSKGDQVITPDGYTYTFHGEQPGAKGKPPIRYWKVDKPLPDGVNAKGVAVTDEAIRRNGLVHPDDMAAPPRKVLTEKEIGRYQGLVKSGGKEFDDQRYPVIVKVRVTFKNGEVIEDAVKGLNEGHGMARAAGNWPSAVKIESLGVETAATVSTQTATAQASIRLPEILSTTPLGGILMAGAAKDDTIDPTPKHGSPLALKNALWAVPLGIFAYGVHRWFKAPEFRLALKQFTRLDKAAPADLERVFETFLSPLFPDRPANGLGRISPALGTAGGVAAGAFVGSKAGRDEASPVGALLGAAAGAAMGAVGGDAFSKIFKTPLTYRQLYKMYFTEAAGMSPSAVQAKYLTRVALEGRIQELKDVAEELDKFDDVTSGAIQAWMSGNANISTVPQNAQAAAQRARILFDNLTTDLLKSGLIKDKILRDTLTSNMGTYVPRMFLRYELEDKPLEIVNSWLKGQGKNWGYISSKEYLKARKDLPPAVLKALGEIVDNPGYLLARRGTVVAADIEQARYHRFLMSSPENVIPGKLARVQKRISILQRQMHAGTPGVAAKPSLIKAAKGNLLTQPQEINFFKAEGGMEAATWQGRTYWKMPDNPKYGLIRNQFVEQAVASDIMATHETTSGLQKLFNAPLSMFKYFKAVMNPASQFRNMITNTILADIEGGIAPWRMDKWTQGLQDLASKGDWYKRARNAGTFGGQFTVSEIEGLLLPHAQKASGMPDFIGTALLSNANKPAQFFTKWHQSSEALGRMTVFRHAVEKLGLTEAEAANFARRTIPDYQDVQRWVKVVRQSPFGAPFISFSYKALPRSLEAAVAFGDPKKMMRFWKYPFAMAALNEYSAQTHGLLGKDEDTDLFGTLRRLTLRTLSVGTYNPNSYDTFRKFLPNHVGGMQIGVPWRDRFDRQQYLDGTFFLPWGDAGEMGKGDFAKGTGLGWFPRQLEPSNPWFQLGVAGVTGKDSFTGRDIIPAGAVGMEATAAWGQFLMRSWGPSLINPAGYGYEAMGKSFSGDYAGNPNVKTPATAVASEIGGLRTRPVNPETDVRFKVYEFKEQMEKNLSEIRKLARLPANAELTDAQMQQMLAERPSNALARAIRRRFKIADDFEKKYPADEIPPSPEKLVEAIRKAAQ